MIYVSVRLDFFAFIAMVINCTAGMERKSQKIEVVATAAERYLGVRDVRSVTGCVKWWFSILSGCSPELEFNRFK